MIKDWLTMSVGEKHVHLSALVPPVIPSSRGDDLVHESVSKDHPGEIAPCSAQEEGTWPGDLAADKGEACFLKEALPLLRSQGSKAICYSMQMAILIEREPVSEYEIHGTFDVAFLEVVPPNVIIQGVLCSDELATYKGCRVCWYS